MLRGFEFWVAVDNPLLPCHLIQVFIVEDADDPTMVGPVAPVFRDRDQLRHVVHLHGAVADQSDDRAIGMGIFGGDGIGHGGAHRGQSAGQ